MIQSITQTQAQLRRLLSGQSGQDITYHMPSFQREAVEKEAAARGVTVLDLVTEAADAGDDKDRRIALLEAHILMASDGLAAWLTDNTDEAFEEEPEIDDILSQLRDACA